MRSQIFTSIIVSGICLVVAVTTAQADLWSKVPAHDPAYKALAQLSDAGWREQRMDASRRPTVLTRYEFTLEVAKALLRATAQAEKEPDMLRTRAESVRALRALMAQFKVELEKLGVDVTAAHETLDKAMQGAQEAPPPRRQGVSSTRWFNDLPPIALTSEIKPWMKDLWGTPSKPLVMTSLGAGLLAVEGNLFRDPRTQEPQRLIKTEFKLPVNNKLSVSASLAALRSLGRDHARRAWSAEVEYALGRWKLHTLLQFAGSDQLASALWGTPSQHRAVQDGLPPRWRSLGGGITYSPRDWLTLTAGISNVTDLTQTQSHYILSTGGVGISLKDRIALEVNWLHINPFDPALSSSLTTRLGLKAAISPSTQWQLFYQMYDNPTGAPNVRPNIVGTQLSIKF
ncbi:MAG: hypothetical protein NZT92_12515 [Abditibacteriales bacterium]|nr:hypothetical protein [Abditibacteriales bacterium]MDW8365780.1 hypothetical protein [Abditibacteriales bacterium]